MAELDLSIEARNDILEFPIYAQYAGIYLMLKSPDQKKHKLPNRIYWAVAKGKSWLRVDVTICFTMSVVFFGFAIILFYGFFKVRLLIRSESIRRSGFPS